MTLKTRVNKKVMVSVKERGSLYGSMLQDIHVQSIKVAFG